MLVGEAWFVAPGGELEAGVVLAGLEVSMIDVSVVIGGRDRLALDTAVELGCAIDPPTPVPNGKPATAMLSVQAV